jgi:hypothetical protein
MPDFTTVAVSPSALEFSLNEAQLVQNTALGGVLIWQFVRAFANNADRGCQLPLCFIVLPILFQHATRDAAESTSSASSMSKFVEKFERNREQLLAIHGRMVALRSLTLRSVQLACNRELIAIDASDATVIPLRSAALPARQKPERLRKMLRAAEKLGVWVAPQPISNISSALRVYF